MIWSATHNIVFLKFYPSGRQTHGCKDPNRIMALMALAQARAGNTGSCEAMTAASVTTK
ncbi:hypothetical protein IU318_004185 [Escherichia coli]|nr:hypothetical protein [Escherichia coli]EGO6546479.1 hypothetical protein [Escherichia coli]EGO6579859.1 hypothetical protein [Escherichia coli]EGO6595153.1 hypothetical protein [Escherichia coli]EGO6598086.1 hypothetical protein [Escherichia coli]